MNNNRLRLAVALCAVIAGLAKTSTLLAGSNQPATPEWTVMVFMNGDNNLEPFALRDFREMARVGGNADVNVIVQMDRIGTYAKPAAGEPIWTDTKRFVIKKGTRPTAGDAIQSLGEVNMGDPAALQDFVKWGRSAYPAKRYMLVIWDHGQGYRNLKPANNTGTPFRSSTSAPHRSVSDDDTDADRLFNSEVVSALTPSGMPKLDILGFDACLMAMVETAYAMRDVAQFMVGSEELEPGDGWQYNDVLTRLLAAPRAATRDVAAALVASYKDGYAPNASDNPTTTQSAIDLSQASALAASVSALGEQLSAALSTNASQILKARLAINEYAPGADPSDPAAILFHHVDLGLLARTLSNTVSHEGVREAAASVEKVLSTVVVANYAGSERRGRFGSTGLAIYFPRDAAEYARDRYEQGGYRKDNTTFPVAFVRDHKWADFLHRYMERFPTSR
jgi:hypothetical protein